MSAGSEIRAIALNYVEATKIVSRGARAYLLNHNNGNAAGRIEIMVISRSGRWIRKWEDGRRLGLYRVVTVVKRQLPSHLFDDLRSATYQDEEHLQSLARELNDLRRRPQPQLDAETLQRVRRSERPPADSFRGTPPEC